MYQANFNPITAPAPFRRHGLPSPNDVIRWKPTPTTRCRTNLAFATLTLKGVWLCECGRAGAVIWKTGEYDYAWNMQAAPDVTAKMAEGGKGSGDL